MFEVDDCGKENKKSLYHEIIEIEPSFFVDGHFQSDLRFDDKNYLRDDRYEQNSFSAIYHEICFDKINFQHDADDRMGFYGNIKNTNIIIVIANLNEKIGNKYLFSLSSNRYVNIYHKWKEKYVIVVSDVTQIVGSIFDIFKNG